MSNETAELACTYAALILYDDGQDITGEKISTLVKAANIEVEPHWPKLFAKAVSGQDISSFFNFGGSAAQSSGPAPAVTEAPKEAAKPDAGKGKGKKAPQPPKQQDDEEEGMGGLFD